MKKAFLAFIAIHLLAGPSLAAEWKPVSGHLMTRWAKEVSPDKVLPEYPRPQMVRSQWENLNGLWGYAIADVGTTQPAQFNGKILVPFCIESALSGVKRPLTPDQRLWYRREFTSPDLTGGKRLLLHFGAVDWEANVLVNGKSVGEHKGGYDAFTCDITDVVKPGAGNELIVSVFDVTGGMQPRGKQNLGAIANPKGIRYTPCSGIWQTVWLETVPATYIQSLHIVPDLDGGAVAVTVNAKGGGKVKLTALAGDKLVATSEGEANEQLLLKIPHARLWTPDEPFLYDLRVECGQDEVKSYFGMRKIALGKDDQGTTRILLNGKVVFQAGLLDQGYWPDGIYTAPTDEALRYDIEMTKKLGFNLARKHVKVEPDRWYYWCDKLGLLVWQDMPNGGAGQGAGRNRQTHVLKDGTAVSPEANRQFETELKAMIEGRWNHPSIVMWVVFNEGWGQYDTPRLTKWVKSLDPSRLVNNASGGHDFPSGDIMDSHNYPGPVAPHPTDGRAGVLGEFGGLGLAVPNHTWVQKNWGYQGTTSSAELTNNYVELLKNALALKNKEGLNALIYTQTTDVETECNGLLTYDREIVKPDLHKSVDALRDALPQQTTETTAGWLKDAHNPVLGGGLGTCFDISVLREGDVYRMWFSWRPKKSIALVESRDGINWSKPSIVLSPPDTTKWENELNRPVIIKNGDLYQMWYTGQAHGKSWIGHAISKDGKQWQRQSDQPVLSPELPWEKVAVMCPHVIYDQRSKLYRMWYSGGEQGEPNAIGYATSSDGLKWAKHKDNPIFRPDGKNAWEKNRVTACQVLPWSDGFLMFYIGFRDESHAQIGVARSHDGITQWIRHPANPIIRPGKDTWDCDSVYKPYAIYDGRKWLLWYNGRQGAVEQIGLAVHEGGPLGF